jgi:site-specific DNA recombinase
MKTYFAYIRVSTQRQGVHGSSLQEQRSAIEAYASRLGLKVVDWFEERETAAKQGRRVFSRMLAALERGSASGVIVHKIDRSARNLKDWAQLNELIDRGIEVLFVVDNLDMTTRGGRLSADIQAVVAADYIRNLKQEVRKGIEGRLKQGLYPLAAPRGYLDCGGGKPKAIDPFAGPLVREAFELYASGNYSLKTLSNELYRRGLRSRGGTRLVPFSMSTMLRNPFYVGLIHIPRHGKTYEGAHPPLIPTALFRRVQDVLDGRLMPRGSVHAFLYRRLIRCQGCGHSLVGERQKGHVYYRCHSKSCQGTSLREERVTEVVTDFFRHFAFTDQDYRDLRDMILADADDTNRGEAQRAQARLALGKADERMARLTDAMVDGLIDKQAFEERKARLLIERRELLDRIEGPEETDAERLLKNLELGATAHLQVETGNPDEIRLALHNTSSNLTALGKKPAIKPGFPFDDLAKRLAVQWGGPDHIDTRTDVHSVQAGGPNHIDARTDAQCVLSHGLKMGDSNHPVPEVELNRRHRHKS